MGFLLLVRDALMSITRREKCRQMNSGFRGSGREYNLFIVKSSNSVSVFKRKIGEKFTKSCCIACQNILETVCDKMGLTRRVSFGGKAQPARPRFPALGNLHDRLLAYFVTKS
jgi:hypothetical protein